MAKLETATLGGGCFWCLEAVYQEMAGVERVESGYMGGHVDDPTYRAVCSGTTGHAEVIQVTFDPEMAPFERILAVFFAIHDPTTLDRQGNDVGSQYRSAIFHHSDAQRDGALRMIRELDASGELPGRVVTRVEPTSTFYKAEDYHQDYYRGNANQGYCMFVVAPKLDKFRRKFAEWKKR